MKFKLIPEKDLREFWKIQKDYIRSVSFNDVKKDYSKNKNLYVGCYEGKELIGIAYGRIKGNEVILEGIAVKHKYWRKGIGRKLLEFFEKQVKKLGMNKISVGAAKNVVGFYSKCGYKRVKERQKFIVMEKFIRSMLTEEEKKFIEAVKKKDYKKGGSFVLSKKGNIYHGIPFEAAVDIHGEENAIGAMLTAEGLKAKFKIILIIGSAKEIIMPCGRCRVSIKRYGTKNVTILCSTKSLKKIEKYTISELYPYPCDEKWLFEE